MPGINVVKKTMAAAGAAAAATALSLIVSVPASAAPSSGAACAQAGIRTLKSLGLLQAAASRSIDYSTLADAEDGPIYADLPAGSYLSLGYVVKLHHSNPELFAWCR
jgi:hypothetical protein